MGTCPELPGAGRELSAENFAADHQPLHLARTFVNLGYSPVSIVPFDLALFDVAIAAMDLNRLRRHLLADFAAEELRHRCLSPVRLALVFQAGCPQREESSGLDLNGHVGDHPLNGLEFGNCL